MVIVFCLALEPLMEALFVSTGVVALAEIGDKTQLLAFILAARFKKPIYPSLRAYWLPQWSIMVWQVPLGLGLPW